jgi:hypothetical protein
MVEMKKRIADVLAQHPTLNSFGFGLYRNAENRKLSPEDRQRRIEEGQKYLYDHADEVAFVADWLSDVVKTKQVAGYSSYGLKHTAERQSPGGYIANGSFIVGAIIAGFQVKQDGPNAKFNMSVRSIKLKESVNSRRR